MRQLPAVMTLPDNVRQWVDETIIEGRFRSYKELAGELKAKGFTVSKSALHRYGKALREKQSEPLPVASDGMQLANALCILAASISHPENVQETAKGYMSLARNEGANGG